MTWNRDIDKIIRINCFVKKIIFTKRVRIEYVMILNCFRIDCIIRKLHSLCYWLSNIFSLYDLFETWSFIFDYKTKTFIASRYWHDYSNQYFIKWIAFTKHDQFWTRHNIECQIIRINCIIRKIEYLLHDLFATWLYFLSMSMFCNWYKDFKCLFLTKFFFLNHIFSENKTRKTSLCV